MLPAGSINAAGGSSRYTRCMPHEPWPLRKSDMLFVLVVVVLALALPAPAAALLTVSAILAWIRFRVFGGHDEHNTRR